MSTYNFTLPESTTTPTPTTGATFLFTLPPGTPGVEFVWTVPVGTIPPRVSLVDLPDYGNIGLLGPAVVLLHFNEPEGVMPSDAMGNLDDLAPTSGAAPLPAAAWTGVGRHFAGTGLVAADIAGRDTLQVRDATIQAILSVERSAIDGTAAIVVRGIDGSSAERYSLGLELVPEGGNELTVRWLWQDSAGVLHQQEGATFEHAGDDTFILLTATRRWESATSVVLRYYLGETLLAEVVSEDGDIAGATTGHTSLGARRVGATWTSFYRGVIDDLKITGYEMPIDEIRATWRRLTVHQPAGLDMLRGLVPRGSVWFRDHSSRIARVMRVLGQGVGFVVSKAEELRATWLPDSAYADRVERWERIRGITPRARDSLDTRRTRLLSLFQRTAGYKRSAIRTVLREPFDQTVVTILEFENVVSDSFATLEAARWSFQPSGVWTVGSGYMRVQLPISTPVPWDYANAGPHARMSLSSGKGEISVTGAFAYAPAFPEGVIAGLMLHSYRTRDALWFGVRRMPGPTYEVAVHSFKGGVHDDTLIATLATWGPSLSLWLRMTATGPGTYRVEYSTGGSLGPWVAASVVDLIVEPEYAGFGVVGTEVEIIDAPLDVLFSDFVSRAPRGDRVFHWYAYRDPLQPGTPDMLGAQFVVEKVKPAHTHAAAISSLDVLCDDPSSGCDRGPLGGV